MARSEMDARDKVGVARLKVWDSHPYLMDVLFKLKPVERNNIDSIAVDAGLRLYYSREYVERCDVESLATVLMHECQHILRNHPVRGDFAAGSALKGRYAQVADVLRQAWGIESFDHAMNICGDLEINDDIHGMKWPEEPVMPKLFGFKDGLSMEEYVVAMVEWAEKQPKQPQQPPPPKPGGASEAGGVGDCDKDGGGNGEGEDESDSEREPDSGDGERDGEGEADGGARDPREGEGPGDASDDPDSGEGARGPDDAGVAGKPKGGVGHGNCGGCSGHDVADKGLGEGGDVPDATSPDELEVAKAQVAHAVMEAAARGTMPAGWLLDWANKRFAKPETDWRKVLAAHVVGAVCAARGHTDWKVGPPSRRREIMKTMGHGEEAPIMSVLRGPEPKVTFVLDTSGSMGGVTKGSRLDIALNEAFGLVRTMNCEVFGIACDAAVHAAVSVKSPADILKLSKGGGGTDMRIGIKAAADDKNKPDVVVLITDGETPWPTKHEMPRRARVVVCVTSRSTYAFDNMPKHLKAHAVYVKGGTY